MDPSLLIRCDFNGNDHLNNGCFVFCKLQKLHPILAKFWRIAMHLQQISYVTKFYSNKRIKSEIICKKLNGFMSSYGDFMGLAMKRRVSHSIFELNLQHSNGFLCVYIS